MLPSQLSQSSLQDYADCERRFELRHIEQLPYPAEESAPALENEKHLQEGSDFHLLAQQYLLGIPPEKLAPLANTPNLRRWLENLLRFLAEEPAALSLRPEASLSAPLPPFRLTAKFDLLASLPEGKIILYDWKTERKHPSSDALRKRWQTRVYRALLTVAGKHLHNGKEIDPEQIEMVYWFAEHPQETIRLPYSARQFKEDWQELQERASQIARQTYFPPTSAENKCTYCVYRSLCERGIGAGGINDQDREAETELDLMDSAEVEL